VGRFRVNVFQQQYQIGMVVRLIETRIPTIEQLHLPATLKELVMADRGLVLLAGATGSGKSSTLAAMIGYRNRNSSGHIISIEDPIEFIHSPERCIITQREVGADTDSYDNALKNAFRQAPDVIYIGEIRSRETMAHAITFADTGHLCLSTLHAKNAGQALDRIVNFFPRDRRDQLLMDLSLNLRAIVAQRLIPARDGRGRRVATEILINTPLVADLILRGEIHLLDDVIKNSGHYGMKTFDQAVYDLYKDGQISLDGALQYANSATDVRLMIKLGPDANIDNLNASIADYTLVEPELQSGSNLKQGRDVN
jgi:twitching motility protein PilU